MSLGILMKQTKCRNLLPLIAVGTHLLSVSFRTQKTERHDYIAGDWNVVTINGTDFDASKTELCRTFISPAPKARYTAIPDATTCWDTTHAPDIFFGEL